jgi:hypothetical protein
LTTVIRSITVKTVKLKQKSKMAKFPLQKSTESRQPLFGHGSLINPTAEHTILDPFQPPNVLAAQVYQNLAYTALAAETAEAFNPLDPVIIRPGRYISELSQPPAID